MNGNGAVQKQERYIGENSVITNNPGTELNVYD